MRRIISFILLAAILSFSMIPASTFASDTAGAEGENKSGEVVDSTIGNDTTVADEVYGVTPAPTIQPEPTKKPEPTQKPKPKPKPKEENVFSDVYEQHEWAFDAIKYFYDMGILQGNGDGTFAPDENITREEFAKIIAILFNIPEYQGSEQTFGDVDNSRWSYKYIEAAKQYLTGYYPFNQQPFFNPGGKATREDIAVALVKVIGLNETHIVNKNILEERYKDAFDVSPALKDYVSVAVEQGLIRGYEDGSLRPMGKITRAEAVVLLFRAIKAPVNNQPQPVVTATPTPLPFPDGAEFKVVSNQVLHFSDGNRSYEKEDLQGKSMVIWSREKDGPVAWAGAIVKINNTKEYDILLTEVISCSKDTVEGYFSLSIDGTPYKERVRGKAYGLEYSVGEYYKIWLEEIGIGGSFVIKERVGESKSLYQPPPTPDPSTTTIWVEKPFLCSEKEGGEKVKGYEASGCIEMSFKNPRVLFNVTTFLSSDYQKYCNVWIKRVDDYSLSGIKGLFSVNYNGTEVASDIPGKVTIKDLSVGSEVVFESEDGKWYMSTIISKIKPAEQ